MQCAHTWNRKPSIIWVSLSALISTRFVAAELGIRLETAWEVLRAENMHSFYVQKAQILGNADYPLRVEGVARCLKAHRMIHSFQHFILRWNLFYNRRRGHPKILAELRRRKCTTCSVHFHLIGIQWHRILRPYLQPECLNGANYIISYSTSSQIWYRKYRLLCARTCGSCIRVHKHILRLLCVTTSMLYI